MRVIADHRRRTDRPRGRPVPPPTTGQQTTDIGGMSPDAFEQTVKTRPLMAEYRGICGEVTFCRCYARRPLVARPCKVRRHMIRTRMIGSACALIHFWNLRAEHM